MTADDDDEDGISVPPDQLGAPLKPDEDGGEEMFVALSVDESDGRFPPGGGGAIVLLGVMAGLEIGGEARPDAVGGGFQADDSEEELLVPFITEGFKGAAPPRVLA